MINTQYGNLNSPITTGQNSNSVATANSEHINVDATELMTNPNRDTFEHMTTEKVTTYSPETIGKGVSVNSVTSTTTRATTDYQRERIPKFLAAKMAGLRTYSDGSPIINSASDYQAYQNARNTISGDHAKINVKSEYRYSQTSESYGNPNPTESCDTFAFATALSIKYNKKITPDQIVIGSGGFVRDHWDSDDDRVMERRWKDGNSTKTAYRIYESRGNDTLAGIDAQLQLGNPVLIHTSGKSAQTGAAFEHWATVIGKENGRYRIIDPWDGSERWLEDMEIYKNGGSILDYTILTDEY